MKVLLIQADGSYPNLVLMKISAFHKSLGDTVFLKRGLTPDLLLECPDPDRVYISCIFEWNRERVLRLASKFNGVPTEVGGYGISGQALPDQIDHLMPDYSLYGIDYSLGFATRGCNRRCPWCSVWRNEGDIHFNAPIEEFLAERHKKLLLFDNNFLAFPGWYAQLRKIQVRKVKICFFQGLDIRLVDHEVALELESTLYYDARFQTRSVHFAFDDTRYEDAVLEGIRTLEKAGVPRKHLTFYVLTGFKKDLHKDYLDTLHRINLLIKEGVKPYVMPFNNRHDSYYKHLERWINGRYYKVVPWEKYDHGNSQEVITQVIKVL